jgi:predicted permease
MLQDLRYLLRQLRRSPAFGAVAVVTLALGIGANTAIFSLLNAFLRPLPVPDAGQLVVISNVMPGDETGLRFRFSFPALQDYRARATVFSDVFAYDIRIGGLSVNGKTLQFTYQMVSGNLFPALRLAPAAGRLFSSGEGERPNSEAVLVLGYGYWQRRFGGDRGVIGTVARFDGMPIRIVGVAPQGFRGLVDSAEMDGYVPLGTAPRFGRTADEFFTDRSRRGVMMLARLRPGVTLAQAQANVDLVARQLAAEYPATERGTTATVIPEPYARPFPMATLITILPLIRAILLVLSTVVLIIACTNVANLLLIRATVREREMAVRASLGASRARLIGALLIESGVLAVCGTALGLGLGWVLNVMLLRTIDLGTSFNFSLDPRFDWAVFTYAALTAIVTGLVVGALPARKASRASVTGLLHEDSRTGSAGATRNRVRQALVVAQIAGSLVLLIVAGLCVRNLRAAQRIDLGFNADQVLTARLDTLNIGMDGAHSAAFYDELRRRAQAMPGVTSASLSFSIPLGWIFGGYQVRREDDVPSDLEPRPAIGTNSVSPEYFDTLQIPITRGRVFTSQDDLASTRVAIVNEALARRLWPDQEPIRKRVVISAFPNDRWQVVGVAKTTKYLAVFEHDLPHLYLPLAQNPSTLRQIEVRSTAPLAETRERLAGVIGELEPDLPIADMKSLRQTVNGNLGFVLFHVGAWQAGAMGTLGLVLALIGIYGVVSYQTSQRAKEIGIRIALGAEPDDVRGLVLRQGAWLIGIGIAAGLVLTFTLTAAVGKVLVLVSATDPLTFVVVTVLLAASALAACYIPAHRATRVPPVEALRHE